MKEIRFFYAPDVAADAELPADEAAHCLRVLRLQAGDEIRLTDGKGMFYKAEITTATGKRCLFKVLEAVSHPKEWSGHLHLALAPTKNMDRIEWLAEKATEIGFERIITTGAKAQLYGNNLDKVNSIVIGGKTATDIAYTENGENSYIEYTVPEGLADGTYRIILVDNGGNEYGGNKVTVTSDALITAGSERTTANSEWVMTGINLNQIESFTFGGQTVSSFIRQSETEIAFTCPSLEDGEYTLTGRTTSGKEVMFYTTAGNITEQTVVVSSERVLWEGHHYVSWDLPDDNPNKTFNLIGKDVFASIKAGAVLSIYYSVNSADEYHQLRTTTGWWNDLPGTAVIEFQEDGVKQVQLTQEVLDKIQTEDGFLCIGHGYYVDRISVQ